jgi:membrane associated rhomboid family serine protease
MFFFPFPIGDENPRSTTPYVNYALLAINIIIFIIFGFMQDYQQIVMDYGFIPARMEPRNFITSIFLHGSLGHLIGNMIFLWIVGDNIEDKLGHVWYLFFYLAGGIAANFFHSALIPPELRVIPAIGASGAISAVLGAYAIMFPKNKIVFIYFVWIILIINWGKFRIASLWAIGFWFLLQLFYQFAETDTSVAYGAHIGGFVFGVIIIGILIFTGLVEAHWKKRHDEYDM